MCGVELCIRFTFSIIIVFYFSSQARIGYPNLRNTQLHVRSTLNFTLIINLSSEDGASMHRNVGLS